MKVLCFGSCNIDYVYSLQCICKPGETVSADRMEIYPGGKGLNQAVALAKAESNVYFAGCVGPDGDFLKDVLTSVGVHIKHLKTIEEKTGHAIIQVDRSAENSIVIYSGANGCITQDHIDTVLKDFTVGDILLIQNEINNLPYLVHKAGELGMQIYFNPSPINDQIKKIDLKWIRCLIVNESEMAAIVGTKDVHAIQSFIKKHYPNIAFLLTLGKQGSVYITANSIINQCAYKAEAVDTTAAGDTYTGYYLSSISRGYSVKAAMNWASVASSIAVSRVGASVSIPKRSEVEAAISKLMPNETVD